MRTALAVGIPALAILALHATTGGRYPIFRDELYYLDCARHLDWGYVDHPPLSIALLAGWRSLFGDSLPALRMLPALCGAILVILTGWMAREMDANLLGQGLAAVAALTVPSYLGITGFYSMNAFDLVAWAAAFLILIRFLRTGRSSLWISLGLVLGIGLQNKISLLTLGAALAGALLLTSHRRELARREIWIGGVLAILLFLPYLLWQATHDWATLEFMHNAATRKIAALGFWGFTTSQLLEMHPFNIVLSLAGLGFLWAHSGGRYRLIGIIFVLTFLILALQRSKPYYLVAAYPPLLAAGACAVAGTGERRRPALAWGVGALLLIGGALTAPFAVPVLPVERFVAYQKALGVEPASGENQRQGPLPQHFADRFGWQELAAGVAQAYRQLPAVVRAVTGIVTRNYGEAGALNYYGRRLGLPEAATQHNSGYFWGPPSGASAFLIVGSEREDLESTCGTLTELRTFETSPWAMPYEQRQTLFLCRDLKIPLAEAWRRGKHFI
ncbi:MAG TPA: glycosyltransferase family 39 protein [Candidatus Polarisedimenticolia bacterium]|nr:glycosyltransferase family 39 protein [Candidatus Polarisedimenticolia bacterium]